MQYEILNKTHITAEIWEVNGHRVGFLIRAATGHWHTLNHAREHTRLKPSKHLKTVLKRFTKYQAKHLYLFLFPDL